MKKIIIMFAILLIPAFYLQAGVRIGAKAGLNLAKASFNSDVIKTDNFTGFQIGPTIEISGLSGFGIDAAILYSQHGLKIKKTDLFGHEQTVRTLDVPVNLKLKLSLVDLLGCYFTAGPYASFKLDDNVEGINRKHRLSKNFGVGLNFGAGVELLKHLQVGVNYQLALNDDYSKFSFIDKIKNLNPKTRIWSITAAYFF